MSGKRGRRSRAGARGWIGWMGLSALAGLAMTMAWAPAPGTAQTPPGEEECRCVDRSGNEIENCTCLRAPRVILDEVAFAPFDRRAQIGVWVEPSEDEDGAYVTRVQEGGPAEEAGIEAGDVVLEVNGRSLLRPLDAPEAEERLDLDGPLAVQRFVQMVGELEPGEEVSLVVRRDGERRTLTVTPEAAQPRVMVFRGPDGSDMARSLRELEGLERRARMERDRGLRSWRFEGQAPTVWRFDGDEGGRGFRVFSDSLGGEGFRFLARDPCFGLHEEGGAGLALLGARNCVDGVELIELNEELGAYFDASRGVLVVEVAEESELGLRPGDVVLAIDGRTVETPGHARRILESYTHDEEIRLRVRRQGREIEVLGRRLDA